MEYSFTDSAWDYYLPYFCFHVRPTEFYWHRAMPVKKGHVAPQNTFIETIIRKFDGQRKSL